MAQAPAAASLRTDQASENFELFPPSNLIADNSLPSAIVVTWDVPIQQDVSFQVQQNTTPDEVGAVDVPGGNTRGSVVIVKSEVPLYFRVRSISKDFRYSSWTIWVEGVPGDPVGQNYVQGWLAQERVVTEPRTTPDGMFTLIIGELDVQEGGVVDVAEGGNVYIVPETAFL